MKKESIAQDILGALDTYARTYMKVHNEMLAAGASIDVAKEQAERIALMVVVTAPTVTLPVNMPELRA